ncbi:MAG: extensin family protein [Rhodospirillaceae bacterium]|nr:extensin family protein [Rhodospirillaceae bacterium]
MSLIVIWILIACALSSCTSITTPDQQSLTLPQISPETTIDDCLKTLDRLHVNYERVKDWTTPEGCGIKQTVRINHSAIEWNHRTLMSCHLATIVWDFETKIVQPAAQRNLGQRVRKMSNAGSYNCRGKIGGRLNQLSQHSFGLALDVTEFELNNGVNISVLNDWNNKGAKGAFLHEVAKGACKIFNVVITPNRNLEHRDHIHLDIGSSYKICGY